MTDDIPDTPLGLPRDFRPAGASKWGAGHEGPSSEGPAPQTSFSPESERVIAAIEEGMREPTCSQIDGYGPHKISAQINGENRMLEGLSFASLDEYLVWLKKMVDEAQDVTTWRKINDERMGVLTLPGGARLTIYLSPISRPYPTFSLRKHTAASWKSEEFVKKGALDSNMLNFLRACIVARVNILFVGQMSSGKTTLLRSLAEGFGDNERIAIIEQVPEIHLDKPLVVQRVYQPTVEGFGLADVLDYALYDGLDRLIVGEVHLDGITKMLETMITTDGSMSTYHAFSTDQAGERMKLGLQIETPGASAETAASFVRQAVELVVVSEKIGANRRVTQITEIDWRASSGADRLSGSDLFTYNREKGTHQGGGRSPDPQGRIIRKGEKYGVEFPHNWFVDSEELKNFRLG
jgi:pilus assembly protein CpaF